MKALTLWQPWAQLVALGIKWVETRSWSTTYRGPLLIHAAARKPAVGWPSDVRGWVASHHRLTHHQAGSPEPVRIDEGYHLQQLGQDQLHPLPLGAMIAVAELTDVVPMVASCDWPAGSTQHLVITDDDLHLHAGYVQQSIEPQRPFGDFAPGRFAWLLRDVRPLAGPIPCTGHQRLWNPSPELVAQVTAT